MVLDIATVACVAVGLAFFLAGTVGLLRFPGALARLHALTKADNLGLGLMVLGAALQAPSATVVLKLIAVWGLVLAGSATSGPLLGSVVRRAEPRA